MSTNQFEHDAWDCYSACILTLLVPAHNHSLVPSCQPFLSGPQAVMHACKQTSVFHGSVCYVRAYAFQQISRRPPFHKSNCLFHLSQPLLTETLMHKGSIFAMNLLLVKYHFVTNMLQSKLSDPQHFENTWSAYLSKGIHYSRMICTSPCKLCQYYPSDLQHVRCSHK